MKQVLVHQFNTAGFFISFQFTYKADLVQLTFLQLLSSEVYQNITYHCKNSAAYYDREEQTFSKAAKFLSSNDVELDAVSRKFRYNVIKDECQVRLHWWQMFFY